MIGPFQVLERLGAGGMGEVYRGRLGSSEVALKVLTSRLARRPDRREDLVREVRAVATLDHPAVIAVHDYGTLADGSPWMAMALARGGTLADHPPSQWSDLRDTLITVLRGLAHAHARDIVHRDLKPSNVLICAPGDERPGLKLADFGISVIAGEGADQNVGTPPYMAPEQFAGQPDRIGPWTDLYALGCLAWTLCTGAPPFRGTATELAHAHTAGPLPRLVPRFGVPDGFEGWLVRALAKSPSDRYRSAADAIHGLDLGGATGSASPRGLQIEETVTRLTVEDLPIVVGRQEHAQALPIASAPLPATLSEPEAVRPFRGVGVGIYGLRRPLIGRQVELGQLWQRLLEAVGSHDTRVVGIHGPAGIGKTRLAEAFLHLAREAGCAGLLVGRGEPVLDALRPRLRGLLVHLDPAHPWGALNRWADGRPLVLVLDDPDDDGLRLTQTSGQPALILTTGREPAEGIALGALAPKDWPALTEALLGVSHAIAGRLGRRSQGIPGVATELAAQCVEQGLLRVGDHGLELTGLPRGERPGVDDLEALEVAAALGPQVDRALWERILGRSTAPAEDQLTRRGIVQVVPGGFRFAQAGAIEGIRAECDRWPALNAHCAEHTTDPERRGLHLLEAGRPHDAIDPLLEAAHALHFASQYHRARDLFVRRDEAMEGLPDDDPRWADGWTKEAVTWRFFGEFDRCEALGRRVEEFGRRTGDPDLEADGLITQGLAMTSSNRIPEGIDVLDRAMTLTTTGRVRARGCQVRGNALLEQRRLEEAKRDLLEGLELSDQPPHRATLFRLLGILELRRGNLEGFASALERTAEIAAEIGDRWAQANIGGDLGTLAYMRGDIDLAATLYEQCIRDWHALGATEWAIPTSNLSLVHIKRGDYAKALALADHVAKAASHRANLAGVCLAVQLAARAGLGDGAGFDAVATRAETFAVPVWEEDMPEMAGIAAECWGADPRAERARAIQRQWQALAP